MQTKIRSVRVITKNNKQYYIKKSTIYKKSIKVMRTQTERIVFDGKIGSKLLLGLPDEELVFCLKGWSKDVFPR